MKNKLNPEDQALFRKAMWRVKKFTDKKVRVEPFVPASTHKRMLLLEEKIPDQFSDHEYLAVINSEDKLFYSKPGVSHQTIRLLKRGAYAVEDMLDLHGKIVDEARVALHEFLLECQAKSIRFILIIHGKGLHNVKQPILKNKVNHWLRQTNMVLAFCSAKPRDGGNGALYVYLRRGKQ